MVVTLILCVATSFFSALAWGFNEFFKVNAIRLGFWRSFMAAVLTSPVLFFVSFPEEEMFYIGFLIIGIMGITADILLYHIVKTYKSAGPVRLLNLRVPLAICVGWLLFPESWDKIINQGPVTMSLIFTALFISLASLFAMSRNPVALKVFYVTITPIVLFVSIDLATKLLLNIESTVVMAIFSVFVVTCSMSVTAFIVARVSKIPLIENKEHTLKYSFYVTLAWISLFITKQILLIYLSNPGYYSLCAGASCLWIMLFNKLRKHKDHSSPIAGLCLMLATIVLIIVVN